MTSKKAQKDEEPLSATIVHLAEGVRLRKELWGGLLFRQNDGTVVDVDRDAFALLAILNQKGYAALEDLLAELSIQLNKGYSSANELDATMAVLQQFADLGIIKVSHKGAVTETIYEKQIFEHPFTKQANLRHSPSIFHLNKKDYPLSAPETVHWAITFNCAQACPDCYAARYKKLDVSELDTAGALQVVEKVAKLGVFQLALGGGEPLLRPDLPVITQSAREQGLAVHVTTGLIEDLDFKRLEKLAPTIKSLHIGVKQDRLLSQPQVETDLLRQIVREAEALGILVGANLFTGNFTTNHFGQIIGALVEAGFKRIILLRYKPPLDVRRWLEEKPSPDDYLGLEAVLCKTAKLYPHVEFRLDCAFSFLQRNIGPAEALAAGIRGCVAGDRVMAIAPDGAVYPCSQLMYPGFRAGNILDDDFASFWRSKLMNSYRWFREKRKFKETLCGTCEAGRQCGGCRVFAHDALGSDPGCKSPLFPSAFNLGREGRQAVLNAHFDKHFSISVGQYMELFKVGQKKACKELRNTSWLMPEDQGSHGRKKVDTYIRTDAYLLEEIQDSIGFTSGGAPFASLEEINEWVNGPDLRDYPKWLLTLHEDHSEGLS